MPPLSSGSLMPPDRITSGGKKHEILLMFLLTGFLASSKLVTPDGSVRPSHGQPRHSELPGSGDHPAQVVLAVTGGDANA